MNKAIMVLVLLALPTLGFTQVDVRIFGESRGLVDRWDSELEGENLGGFGWEVVFDKSGMIQHNTVNFDRVETGSPWTMDFVSTLGLSHHFLGTAGPVDLFAEGGFGCAGDLVIDEAQKISSANDQGIRLGLFPYLGAGAAMKMDNMILGARVDWYGLTEGVPGADIDPYSLKPLSVGVFFGFTTGPLGQGIFTSCETPEVDHTLVRVEVLEDEDVIVIKKNR